MTIKTLTHKKWFFRDNVTHPQKQQILQVSLPQRPVKWPALINQRYLVLSQKNE